MASVRLYRRENRGAHSLEMAVLGFEPCLSIVHTLLLAQSFCPSLVPPQLAMSGCPGSRGHSLETLSKAPSTYEIK